MSARVNKESVRVKITNGALNSGKFRAAAMDKARAKVDAAQEKMVDVFESDKVTVDIDSRGSVASDLIQYASKTYGVSPSLYGFIGFDAYSEPLEDLRKLLNEPIEIKQTTRRGNLLYFRVNSPTEGDIVKATPMPKHTKGDISWARGVEDGDIIGIESFVAISAKPSRSGMGLQTKSGSLDNYIERYPYVTKIVGAFSDKLGRLSA